MGTWVKFDRIILLENNNNNSNIAWWQKHTTRHTILGEYKFIIISRVVNNVFVVVTIDGDKNSCTIVVDIHFDVSKMAYMEIYYTFA